MINIKSSIYEREKFTTSIMFTAATAYCMCESAMLSPTLDDDVCPSQMQTIIEDLSTETSARNESFVTTVAQAHGAQSLTDEVHCAEPQHYGFTELLILVGWYRSS